MPPLLTMSDSRRDWLLFLLLLGLLLLASCTVYRRERPYRRANYSRQELRSSRIRAHEAAGRRRP